MAGAEEESLTGFRPVLLRVAPGCPRLTLRLSNTAALHIGLGPAPDLWRTAWRLFSAEGILCGLVHVLLAFYKSDC